MPDGRDWILELALEYETKGLFTHSSFLYDEYHRRYVPPHLDPRSDRFVVPPRPRSKPEYVFFDPISGRVFVFGLVTLVLLTCQCERWWAGDRDERTLRQNLYFLAVVYGTLFAFCESTSIYHLFAIVFILFVIVFVTITFGSAEMEDDEVVLEGNRRDLRRGPPDSQLGAVPGSARSEPGRTSASLSAQVQTALNQMGHPTQMLQSAARTKWRYGDGENEEGLPTFTTLCGRKMGLMLSLIHI